MKLLLDTHILIWSVMGLDRLGARARSLLEDGESELWLSPISIWECLVLAHKGKLRLSPDPISWTRRLLKEWPFRQAPLNHDVAIQSRLVKLPHEDPADRFLAATAAVFDLTLLTSDERLLQGGGFRALPNR